MAAIDVSRIPEDRRPAVIDLALEVREARKALARSILKLDEQLRLFIPYDELYPRPTE